MDYVYRRINDTADAVQRELAQVKLRHSNGIYPISDRQVESEDLSLRVASHLEDALLTIRLAAIYAERVEWLTSGDDGEQSFCERLERQLSEAKLTGGVE